ncbi:class I SAM-dependent methyltransferase [Methylomicrobium sp. Wu6]|uniref:class I SAM-dependent methyltransferase n=1 Tax=Methylomicrobium sp. Wu6 TaxID=3107928 RepID=UPI002DD6A83E|nr:class I SAM-dependent methyltransferase [Methylomicrobium sp. Wu6]MEC4749443.1 class I SAM-dependent methyltransferase [Methylomicrobium sp. Wu6]
MNTFEEAKAKTTHAYNAAADLFDHPANTFWNRFGRSTVARINLLPGERVLDVCSGTGASALPAAIMVGPNGKVIAVDLADKLLAEAKIKAEAKKLTNLEFQVGDMLSLGYPDACFDAAICVFGIFFVPDMALAVKELWRQVRPGGRLAITTWGADLFEPANSLFWQSVRDERPELYKDFNPWDRISNPEGLRAMLSEAGIHDVDIVTEQSIHPLHTPEDWWVLVMGSGYRGTLDQFEPNQLQRVKQANLSQLRAKSITGIEANVIYAIANKPLA